jgi:hypothetical protein
MVSRRATDVIVIVAAVIAGAVYYLAGGAPDPAPAAGVIGGAMLGLAALAARTGARLARLPVVGRVALIAARAVARIAAELPAAVVASADSRARIAAHRPAPRQPAPRRLPAITLTPRLLPVPVARRA